MEKTHNSIAIREHNKKGKQGNRKNYTKQNEKKKCKYLEAATGGVLQKSCS